jgi:hypothetical protein
MKLLGRNLANRLVVIPPGWDWRPDQGFLLGSLLPTLFIVAFL